MSLIALFLVGALGGPNPMSMQDSESEEASLFAFVDVAVVSMQDEQVLEGQTVIIEGERIRLIGATGTLVVPEGSTVIDGSDRYLIPGLVDMHVHVHAPFADGPLYLNAGITTVLALGIEAHAETDALAWQKVLDEREDSRTSDFLGPTLYTAGPQIWGGETPEQAERIVRANGR